jgi:hypothetical protein
MIWRFPQNGKSNNPVVLASSQLGASMVIELPVSRNLRLGMILQSGTSFFDDGHGFELTAN